MASIMTAIQIQDRMSAPLQRMTNAMNIIISSFERMENSSHNAIDRASLQAARRELTGAEADFRGMEEQIRRAREAQERLNSSTRRLNAPINQNTDQQERFNRQLQVGQANANGLMEKIKGVIGAYLGMQTVKQGVGFVQNAIAANNVQVQAETKLMEVMRTRMGANEAMVDSIKKLASAQQNIGVIGDEVQLAGAQQVSTFLNSADSLKRLMPAMNNLAVQQNGVNVSQGDMVNIGNMVGKVMQGQVGALTRVGITFDAAQEKALKYGNEQQRAATLAEVINANVGKMNQVIANTPEGKIQQIKNAWGDIIEVVGDKLYPSVMQFFNTLNEHMPQAESFMYGLANALSVVTYGVSDAIDIMSNIGSFIADNWSVIEPIVYGAAAALGIYTVALTIYKGIQLASAVATGISAAATAIHTAFTNKWSLATFIQTVQQQGLNSALLACPITWIIGGLILLIAVIYTVVAWINKTQNKTLSATGIICGCINVVLQFFKNLAMQVGNIAIGIWNALGAVASNMETAFKNSICNVQAFFWDLLATATDVISGIANKLNKLPFVEIDTSGLDNSASEYAAKAREARAKKGDYQNIASAFDKGMNTYDAFQNDWWKKAYNDGNKFGTRLEKKAKDGLENILDKFKGKDPYNSSATQSNNVPSDVENIKKNTKKSADAVKKTNEELRYIRDIAARRSIDRYTTANINVSLTNNNTINKDLDIDGVVNKVNKKMLKEINECWSASLG